MEPREFTLLVVKRFFRRAWVWLAWSALVIAVLLVTFYVEEDIRGARAWADCQHKLAAKGESLDLRQIAPPGKPEDDLSKVPIFAELYQRDEEYRKTKKSTIRPRIDRLEIDFPWREGNRNEIPQNGNYLRGEPYDLSAWQTYYRTIPETKLSATVGTPAQDILQALKVYDPEMAEINQAFSNTNAFWPVDYEKGFTFVGGATKTVAIAKVLQLRAVADLENGQTEPAEKDLFACLRLNQSLERNITYMNFMIMAANQSIACGILWEGIRRHAWSDGQLREIETAFASEDVLVNASRALRVERAHNLVGVGYTLTKKPWLMADLPSQEPAMVVAYLTKYIRPGGWWNQDRSAYSLAMQTMIEAIHPADSLIDTAAFAAEDDELPQPFWRQVCTPFTAIAIPYERRGGAKIAKTDTYRRLAILACRLEEYRLAQAHYPVVLDQLPDLPPHLTSEVIGTDTFHYQPKGQGYTLYSIGWDQIDDHGALKKAGREIDQGGMVNNFWDADWPWPSPDAKPAEK